MIDERSQSVDKRKRPRQPKPKVKKKKKEEEAKGGSGDEKKRARKNKKSTDTKLPEDQKRSSKLKQHRESQSSGPLRTEELIKLEYKLVNNKEIKLINSTNRSRIYRINLKNDSYKLTVPLSEAHNISLSHYNCDPSEPLRIDKHYMNFVIKNFNNKVSQQYEEKRGILFFINYLINTYDSLKLDPHHYKLYETNKRL